MPVRALPLLVLLAACADDDYTRLYHTQDKADDLSWEAIGNLEHLGPTVYDNGVNFGLYSARAERVELLLFDDPESDRPVQQFPLTRYDDVWNLYVEGVGLEKKQAVVVGRNQPELFRVCIEQDRASDVCTCGQL